MKKEVYKLITIHNSGSENTMFDNLTLQEANYLAKMGNDYISRNPTKDNQDFKYHVKLM